MIFNDNASDYQEYGYTPFILNTNKDLIDKLPEISKYKIATKNL